jgi:predicted ribosome quality control (RQC) complex YloA/Tae2 family protein
MKPYREFSNFDVFVITKELDGVLTNGKILNVYEIEDLLILKINTLQGRKNLIIKSDSRINLTSFDYPIPRFPSQYIMSFRKLVKNRQIVKIYQHNFDRIIVIELSNMNTKPWKFIIELFNKGNFILIDELNNIKVAKRYKKFKERDLLPGKQYSFPQIRGADFLRINEFEFKSLILNSDSEVVRILARNINVSGLHSEEICLRAGIDKNTPGKMMNEKEINLLFKAFKDIRNQLLFGKIDAHIVLDTENEEIAVLPFELEIFKEYDKRRYNSFNDAVDNFYSKVDSEQIKPSQDQKFIDQIKAQKKILKNQRDYLQELKLNKKKYYKHGDFIYSHFKQLENLLNVINSAKTKGYSWEEINNKLDKAKSEKMNGAEFFKYINPSTKQLVIEIDDDMISLDLNKSLGENANIIYNKGKKADKKIKGTIPAIKKTQTKIKRLRNQKDSQDSEANFLLKKPKKHWYEKFRWFKSSDGFLVIGGRGASSNESIFKKYLEPNDLVFHTEFPGSPLSLVKNPENKTIPECTLQEAADFTASFSKAWKETWGVVKVFYVFPNQISKTPPSGEYLPKGSFMISGKKNFINDAKTELAITIKIIELENNSQDIPKHFYPKFICGPVNAIKNSAKEKVLLLKPSKSGLTSGKLANEIKNYYIKNFSMKKKTLLQLLSTDEIILTLPSGPSEIIYKD